MTPARMLATLLLGAALVGCSGPAEPGGRPATHPGPPTSSASSGTVVPPTRSKVTAEDVVADPRSTLDQYEIGGHGAATVWRLCPRGHCLRPKYAVALSEDGFRTRTVLALPVQRYVRVQSVSGGRFVVMGHERNIWLADADGSTRSVRWEKQKSPVADDEVPLMWGDLFGVDLASATMHPVRTPDRLGLFWRSGDEFRGVRYRPNGTSTYAVSVDRGATWDEEALSGTTGALWMAVEGSGVPALVEGADGATLFPFVAGWRLDGDAFRSTTGPTEPTAYVSYAEVMEDGRLLVSVDAWSDQHGTRKPPPTPPGFWVSTDTTWSSLAHVEPGRPFADDRVFQPTIVGSAAGPVLIVVDPDTGRAYTTADAGRTFQPIRSR